MASYRLWAVLVLHTPAWPLVTGACGCACVCVRNTSTTKVSLKEGWTPGLQRLHLPGPKSSLLTQRQTKLCLRFRAPPYSQNNPVNHLDATLQDHPGVGGDAGSGRGSYFLMVCIRPAEEVKEARQESDVHRPACLLEEEPSSYGSTPTWLLASGAMRQ